MKQVLVIVPCGGKKVWDKSADYGSAPARDAYVGNIFKINRLYAEKFASGWVALSAKYGFIPPDFLIPGPYDVTFKRKSSGAVTLETLKRQAKEQLLDKFPIVVGLGGKEYRRVIAEIFDPKVTDLRFPFGGLPIGKAMQATQKAIDCGRPW